MKYQILKNSSLFKGIREEDIKNILDEVSCRSVSYAKGETVFHLMDKAERIGIIIEGSVEVQKAFPNGSQINMALRKPGEMIGAAAAFSKTGRYPCDTIALEDSAVLMIWKEDLLKLMQKKLSILENFTSELATATYMMQSRLEMLSYSGIAQKAAFYLLMQERQTGKTKIRIPKSMSNWALIMNVSRPSLHRELNKMEKSGIISYIPPFITIEDSKMLQNLLNR